MDKKPRILIVDDDPLSLEIVKRGLRDRYEIRTAANGYSAIREAKKNPPDLILLDVMMPGLSGFDVCRMLKAEEAFAEIPVLFLTALDSLDGETLGLELGGIDYLIKPFNIELLKRRVHNHLEMKTRNDLIRTQRNLLARRQVEMEQEILERRRMEAALRESEERYRILMDTLPYGITAMDHEHRILMINRTLAEWYRQAPAWFIGRRCYEIFEGREGICAHCPGIVALAEGKEGYAETEVVRGDGKRAALRLHSAPLQLADGTAAFMEMVEDVTERRLLEAKTQHLARLAALSEMAGGVGHEINNPLNGILSSAELLQERLPADPMCESLGNIILKEGNRIARIVRSLIEITQPGDDLREWVSFPECLEPVLLLFREQLAGDGIDLQLHLPADQPPILCERQQIEQLLVNLVSNARYALNERFAAADPAKILRIRAAAQGRKKFRLEIYDQGTGIPDRLLPRVFDPFFTTKPTGSGNGLGLLLCHQIVRNHGGEIRIESEQGNYTRVMVELPIGNSL